ncbi:sensor histidine kinase [Paenibacillus tarimensis]
MKGNVTAGMMIRFLGNIVVSSILAVIFVFVCVFAGAVTSQVFPIVGRIGNGLYSTFQEMFFIAAWFFFFIVILVLLQWRRFRYFGELSEAVMHIAEGNFEHKVPVKQRNELGDLAIFTNRFVEQLKKSLDDERRAEQTKNELITNVSHDLRTPLTSIIGYLGLIEQDRYRDEVELRHYTQVAYEKSQRLNVLINDLFEYTRMRHDSIPMRTVNLNLVELLGQLLEQYRLPLKQAGLTGELHAAEPRLTVNGDPNKLVRVFENLLSNAMNYGRAGKKVDIYIHREGAAAVVEVANYGEQIPEVDLPYLFDRFYRVDKSRTEHSGGSGLGLAIAKSIVEKHGGTISVSSGDDVTAFQVKLPIIF